MKTVLTEADVLRGTMMVMVQRRDGENMPLPCKALNWASACQVMSLSGGEAIIHSILGGLDLEVQRKDEVLNQVTPEGLVELANVIQQLTHGVPTLKKLQAAGTPNAQPATPISAPPAENCASMDSAAPNSANTARPS